MIFNKHLKNILVSSIPGTISILLSFFSIPIYLKYLGFEQYGNFLILHILLSLAMITNFNLGKIASIKMQKVTSKTKKLIISTTVLISIISSAIISLILYLICSSLIKNYHNLIDYNYELFFLALFFSNIYITLENISKGVQYYYLSSLGNLIFYSFSLSLPAILIIFDFKIIADVNNLFVISVLFKIISIFIISIVLTYKKFLNFNFSFLIIKDFINHAKWQTLSSIYVQIFDFFDKYLIKLFLGATSLSLYSIPQQIAGKLSILSDGIISVFIPKISSSKNKKKTFKILNSNFYAFFYLTSFFLILINPLIDEILFWWLKTNTNSEMYYLFKIFLLIAFYICITHIISTFLDTQNFSKKNFQIESMILIFFIFGLIISVYYKNINYFAYTMLVRSIIGFLVKAFYIKEYLINFNILIIKSILFSSIFIFSLNNSYEIFYILSVLYLILFLLFAPKEIMKKEFLK